MMRIILTVALVIICASIGSAKTEENPYLREGSIGKAKPQEDVKTKYPSQYVPITAWVGERFIFLPRPKETQQYGYQSFSPAGSGDYYSHAYSHPLPYSKYCGRIAKVISVSEDDSLQFQMEDDGERVQAQAVLGTVDHIGPVRDIDDARKKWLNKTLWYNSNELIAYDAGKETFSTSARIPKFLPVKVVDVVAGWYTYEPVRFILKAPSGAEGFEDINWSGTNVSSVLQQHSKFEDSFFTQDPRKIFKWSPKIWAAIENSKVLVGMSTQQAIMSRGKPTEVNRTTTKSGVDEQWVYGDKRYLYFKNGVVTATQD